MCHQPATLEQAVLLMEAHASAEARAYFIPQAGMGQMDRHKKPVRGKCSGGPGPGGGGGGDDQEKKSSSSLEEGASPSSTGGENDESVIGESHSPRRSPPVPVPKLDGLFASASISANLTRALLSTPTQRCAEICFWRGLGQPGSCPL